MQYWEHSGARTLLLEAHTEKILSAKIDAQILKGLVEFGFTSPERTVAQSWTRSLRTCEMFLLEGLLKLHCHMLTFHMFSYVHCVLLIKALTIKA